MRRDFRIDGETVAVTLTRGRGGFLLRLGEREIPCALHDLGGGRYTVEAGTRRAKVYLAAGPDETFIHLDGRTYAIGRVDPLEALAAGAGGAAADVATAPMPGMVIAVEVEPGESVREGQALMTIESMKLQTTIAAWRDGIVAEVHVGPGATFPLKAPLVTLKPE